MPYRPLSFTKNLGGFPRLQEAIKAAYEPGVTTKDFLERVPSALRSRALLFTEFYLATRIVGSQEYIVEDSLVRYTFLRPWGLIHTRLALFALMLNMPGERVKQLYRSPSEAQNAYVRSFLHDGKGWLESKLNLGQMITWVKANVQITPAGARKFSTNFRHLFEQAEFETLATGHSKTFASHWGPLAIRLFFDRIRITNRAAGVKELIDAAAKAELYKLLGVPQLWQDRIITGCAIAYVDHRPDLLTASIESDSDRNELGSGVAGRQPQQIKKLIELGRSSGALANLFGQTCQLCGSQIDP